MERSLTCVRPPPKGSTLQKWGSPNVGALCWQCCVAIWAGPHRILGVPFFEEGGGKWDWERVAPWTATCLSPPRRSDSVSPCKMRGRLLASLALGTASGCMMVGLAQQRLQLSAKDTSAELAEVMRQVVTRLEKIEKHIAPEVPATAQQKKWADDDMARKLFTEEDIQNRISELGKQISKDYLGKVLPLLYCVTPSRLPPCLLHSLWALTHSSLPSSLPRSLTHSLLPESS